VEMLEVFFHDTKSKNTEKKNFLFLNVVKFRLIKEKKLLWYNMLLIAAVWENVYSFF